MSITTLDGSDSKVFFGIDKNTFDNTYEVSYPKYMDVHVRDILAQLPSLLTWIYGPQTLQLMTNAAQEKVLDAPWDEEEMCAISSEDRAMEAMIIETESMFMGSDPDDKPKKMKRHEFEFEDPRKIE